MITFPGNNVPSSRHVKQANFIVVTKTCYEDLFLRKDGTSFPVKYSVTPLWDGGERLGAVVIFQCISARKKRDLWEQDRQENLELLMREKTEGFREANTKLNAILAAAVLPVLPSLFDSHKPSLHRFCEKD